MPYLHLGQQSTLGRFACNSNCRCRAATLNRSLGEFSSTNEFADDEKKMVAAAINELVKSSGRPGIRDVNQWTDQVFFARYPIRNGRLIDPKKEPHLAEEWKIIKNRLVLPILDAMGSNEEGKAAFRANQFVRALKFFDRARRVSVAPAQNRAAATLNLGLANLELKRFAAAIGYFELARTFPGISEELKSKANDNFTRAKEQYHKAIP